MWKRFSLLWTGFWIGAIAAFDWCFYHLLQPGDVATTKAFAYHLFSVHFWCFLLACLPELLGLVAGIAKRVLSSWGKRND